MLNIILSGLSITSGEEGEKDTFQNIVPPDSQIEILLVDKRWVNFGSMETCFTMKQILMLPHQQLSSKTIFLHCKGKNFRFDLYSKDNRHKHIVKTKLLYNP